MPPKEPERKLDIASDEDLSGEYLLQIPTRKSASLSQITHTSMHGGRQEAAIEAKKPNSARNNPPNQLDITDLHN